MHMQDSNVEKVREALLTRSQLGIAKYGCTTNREDLCLEDWLQHALEECLDQAVYLQAALTRLRNTRVEVDVDSCLLSK